MAGFTRRMAERIMDATVRVERSDLGQRPKRRKWPKGGQHVKVFRLTTRALNGGSATGIRQKWNSGDWEDANEESVDLSMDFAYGYHFEDDIVEVRRIGGSGLQIVSPGSPEVRGVLDDDLVTESAAAVSIYDNTWTDTGNVIESVPAWSGTLSETISSGSRVRLSEVNGQWAVVGEIC